jgi:hypothetical protein
MKVWKAWKEQKQKEETSRRQAESDTDTDTDTDKGIVNRYDTDGMLDAGILD